MIYCWYNRADHYICDMISAYVNQTVCEEPVDTIKSHKKFPEQKQAHAGMEPSKTRQTRWEQHQGTFPPSLHLVPFCLVLVYVHGRVVEGNGLDSAHGCVVNADVHGE